MPVPYRALLVLVVLWGPRRAGATPLCAYASVSGAVLTGEVASGCVPYDGDTVCVPQQLGPPDREQATLVVCRP